MQVAEFPLCCGARILYDFFHGELNAETIEKTIKRLKDDHNVGIIIAITSKRTPNQRKAGKLLEGRGFEKIIEQNNPNTDRDILLWVLDTTKRKKVKRPRIKRVSQE